MAEQEYLVVYETEEDEQDDIDLDFATSRAWGYDDDLELEVVDVSNTVGAIGLLVSVVGAVLGVITIFLFSHYYPAEWYTGVNDPSNKDPMWIVAFLSLITAALLLGGTVMTHIGRRINAQGYRVPHE